VQHPTSQPDGYLRWDGAAWTRSPSAARGASVSLCSRPAFLSAWST